MPSLPTKMKILLILAKSSSKQKLNLSRTRLLTRVTLKYFVNVCGFITPDFMKSIKAFKEVSFQSQCCKHGENFFLNFDIYIIKIIP